MSSADPNELDSEKLKAIACLFAGLPSDFPEIQSQLDAVYERVRVEIAKALEPRLNNAVSGKSPGTVTDCRRAAAHIDAVISDLGLCLHVDEEPALLIAERDPNSSKDKGRFAIVASTPQGKLIRKTVSSTIPPLNLIPAPVGADTRLLTLRHDIYNPSIRR